MTDTTYNGWRNRETWLVSLWFLDCKNEPMTADSIRSMVAEALDEDLTNIGVMKGFINDILSLDRIDWEELSAATQDQSAA